MLDPLRAMFLLSIPLALLMGVPGCRSDWNGMLDSARVHGEITLDGKPVEQARIVFIPVTLRNDSGVLMPLAFGLSDATGKFELKYSDGNDKLLAGQYTVIVSKANRSADEPQQAPNWDPALLPEHARNLTAFSNPDELFPAIYNRESILVQEIRPSPDIVRPKLELTSTDPLLIATPPKSPVTPNSL